MASKQSWEDIDRYAEGERQLRAAFRRRQAADMEAAKTMKDGLFCPECGVFRQTPETYRVHRWLAHDIRELVSS